MKLLMENWRCFQEDIQKEKLILEELKKLEVVNEGTMQDLAKKIGVPVAKVMLIAKMLGVGAPAMASGMADMPVEPAQTTQQVDVQETTVDDYNAMIGFINQKIKSDKAKTDIRGVHDIEMEWASLIQALDRARDGNSESLDSITGKTAANYQALVQFIGEMKDTQQDLYQEYVDMGAAWEITSQGTIREISYTVNKS